jgi:hypothetical protein
MKDRTPYFYIIEHVASGKRYAGCRYGKGCHPDELLQPNGYHTSSYYVNLIIKEEGLTTFKIIEIKTQDEIGNVCDYETEFLVENDCAKSDKWFNLHNNIGMSSGAEKFKTLMINKFGVEHPMQSEVCKEKSRQTCLNRYGFDYATKSEVVKEKSRKTNIERRGVECSLQSEEVRDKGRQTCKEKYGVDNAMQNEMIKEKAKNTCIERYAVDNYAKSIDFPKRLQQVCTERYGVESTNQLESVKEKKQASCLRNHGVEHPLQSKELQETYKNTSFEKYGVDNYSKTDAFKTFITELSIRKFEEKVSAEISNGNFGRFEYLYDTIDHVFLIGIMASLNRETAGRYIKISSHNSKKYVDILTGKPYQIKSSRFSVPIPYNFIPTCKKNFTSPSS